MLLETRRQPPNATPPVGPVAARQRSPRAGNSLRLPARAWSALAQVSAFWGARAAAARQLRRALHHAPAHPQISLRLGELLACQERWHEAALVLGEASRQAPTCAETWGNLALALYRAGRLSSAAQALERLAALSTAPADVLLLRATLLRRLGHTAPALHALRAAAQARSTPPGTRFFLGEALLGAPAWLALRAALPPAAALARAGVADVTVGPRRHAVVRAAETPPSTGPWAGWVVLARRAAVAVQQRVARSMARVQRLARHLLGHALERFGRALCTLGSGPLAIRCLRSSLALRS
jgi:tetratricopeptide (TPR) repeat protein